MLTLCYAAPLPLKKYWNLSSNHFNHFVSTHNKQDLEESCLELRLENDRLREVSEVAKNQVEMLEKRKIEKNMELVNIRRLASGLLC